MLRKIIFVLFILLSVLVAEAQTVAREYRAVWLTTYLNLDWPRTPAKTAEAAEKQKAELCQMLDKFVEANLNTVFVQARMRSTTAYPSAYEPWDEAFTGVPGKAPLYDPLAFAVEECHKRGLECHAWVVAFPICKVPTARALGKQALPKKRPDLCRRCGDLWMMDPGVPGTADYLAQICAEIVEKYDVDGIHLDYIRYPERDIRFNDNATYKKYGQKQNRLAWRRDNVTRCVEAIHRAIKQIRPWVRLTCAPIGKHDDLNRQSSYGWNARTAVAQDAQRWLSTHTMDALFPMMYFDGVHFYPFAADWQENNYGHPVVPGLGIYFLNPKLRGWDLSVVQRQMNVSRWLGLGGQAFFRAQFLLDNEKGLYDWLKNEFYNTPAFTPALTWADSIPPQSPTVELERTEYAIKLSWTAVPDETPVTYNVYRIDSNGVMKLLKHKLRETTFEYMPPFLQYLYQPYVVTSVDAYGNESVMNPISVWDEMPKKPISGADKIKKVQETLRRAK